MESTYLKTFIEVVKTGSFSRAADNLFVTQSAVSRRIQYMEKQYECLLLDRDGPVLKQTEQGQLLFKKAIKILTLEQELQLEISQKEQRNHLAFVSTPTFGVAYLPQIFSNFLKTQCKAINIRFLVEMPTEIRENLRHGAFEMAVIEHCPEFDLSEFETIALPDDELVFAVATHEDFAEQEFQIEDLFKYPLLCCSEGCCTTVILEKNLKSKGFSFSQYRHVVEITDLDMFIKSLLSGTGVGFISLALIKPFVNSGQLKAFCIPGFIHQRNRSLVLSEKSMNCDLSKQFTEHIVDHFNSPPPFSPHW